MNPAAAFGRPSAAAPAAGGGGSRAMPRTRPRPLACPPRSVVRSSLRLRPLLPSVGRSAAGLPRSSLLPPLCGLRQGAWPCLNCPLPPRPPPLPLRPRGGLSPPRGGLPRVAFGLPFCQFTFVNTSCLHLYTLHFTNVNSSSRGIVAALPP